MDFRNSLSALIAWSSTWPASRRMCSADVNLDLNQVITLNMIMQIGETKETVEVTSEAPLVDTTSTQLGAVMDQRQVASLPLNARDTYQLLQLQPGVQGVGVPIFSTAVISPARCRSMEAGGAPTISTSTAATATICS